MTGTTITRRQFNTLIAAGFLFKKNPAIAKPGPKRIKAAAIQMVAKLGDVPANLAQAERLIRQAIKQGADWIILPEMFTSAVAFHNDVLKAIQPVDGAPLQMMKKLSREGSVVIGGSFLAKEKNDIYNAFFLVFPDGTMTRHNKDLPTYWENCYYKGGKDNGVMSTPVGPVGSVLCWEFIRSQTPKRLLKKVNLVVGGSCWWTLPDDADPASPRWADNLKMLKQAPPNMARMLGVPVIHGSHAGSFNGFFSPDLPNTAYNSSYLGESMIVDAQGKVLASRSRKKGAGVVTASLETSTQPSPSMRIPDTFWMPGEMPQDWKDAFKRWFYNGGEYYKTVTIPYIKTGKINCYKTDVWCQASS
ncbi:MAG: carbon-nitrogen hydrolase family protein [Acidiferrobacterales bacterium]